ncbi:MAG: HupE/UreJ family protein [Hyphomicrobiales bacterium]
MTRRIAAASLALAAMAGAAQAHTGHDLASGFAHGFAHPFSGTDHLLAMFAVGLLAANIGGRALWAVPAAFVSMMVAGGVWGLAGMGLPYFEAGIALSVAVLGLAALRRHSMPLVVAAALAGVFAVFHGYAHAVEMPLGAAALDYALGFVSATVILHAAGLGAGLALNRVLPVRRPA